MSEDIMRFYEANLNSIKPSKPRMITIYEDNGTPLVEIHFDGTLVFGKNYTPDYAAYTFWRALIKTMPEHLKDPNAT